MGFKRPEHEKSMPENYQCFPLTIDEFKAKEPAPVFLDFLHGLRLPSITLVESLTTKHHRIEGAGGHFRSLCATLSYKANVHGTSNVTVHVNILKYLIQRSSLLQLAVDPTVEIPLELIQSLISLPLFSWSCHQACFDLSYSFAKHSVIPVVEAWLDDELAL